MILFEPFIWPFFLVGLSLLITYFTSLELPSKFRKSRGVGPAGEGDSGTSAAVTCRTPVSVRIVRNNGVLWFCAGVATIVYALTPEPWVRPGSSIETFVGVFWVVIGLTQFRSSFPRRVVRLVRDGEDVSVPTIVTAYADRACGAGQVGLVIGAVAGKEEFLGGFGALEVGGTEAPDAETVFEIGSISKVFTGILLARAIESGQLNLDDRIAELLPDGWTLPEPALAITLRHCTTHTSGLPRLPANLLNFVDTLRFLIVGNDPYRDYTEEEFRQALAKVKLKREPGTKYEYSNFGVGLLGFVLAQQNGTDYESLVTESVCRPLGMDGTFVAVDERTGHQLPSIYRLIFKVGPVRFGMKSDEWRIPNHLAGAGAIRSTGHDMMTFLKANMGLLSTPFDAAIRRSHEELFRDPCGMTLGMSWMHSFDDELGQNIIWHNGGTGGFRTYLGFTEDRRYGVFVLGNTANSVDDTAVDILKSLVLEDAADA